MEANASTSAEPCPDETKPAWYCVRTHQKHEHIAAAHLRHIAGVDVFSPQLRILRHTRRGRRWSNESLFPNYLFCRFILQYELENVSHTPAVKAVIRFGDRIPAVPDRAIEELQSGVGELKDQILVDAPEEGEEVEIGSGAFAGMQGRVTRILPGKERAQVLLSVLGRPVPAEISLAMLVRHRMETAQIALRKHPSYPNPGFPRIAA